MPVKPAVFLAIKVEPKGFILGSFTANLAHVQPPMDYQDDLVAPVGPERFSAHAPIEVRARFKPIRGPARAVLLGWSSDFEDDGDTHNVDERWHVIASTPSPTADIIELKGTFDPFKRESP
jgi:hypothetical protein